MAQWEFMTFSVLIGALLLYTSLITRRLGRAEARLKKIEAELLARSHIVESAIEPAVESAVEPAATPAPETKPRISDGQESRGAYLTIRDLRARSEQRATRGEPLTLPSIRPLSRSTPSWESQDASGTSREPLILSAMRAMVRDAAPASFESRDVPATTGEPPHLSTTRASDCDAATASSESQGEPELNSEPHSPPDHRPSSDDSVARKNQDTVLFLNAQRRRRRARLGF